MFHERDRCNDGDEGRGCSSTPIRGSKGGTAVESPPAPPPPGPPTSTQAPPPPPGAGPPRRAGATAGVVLILVGAVFLAAQFLPGVVWWTLWPAVIIIAGLVQAFTPGHEGWGVNRLFDGLVTVAIGFVLLAVTTGLIGFGVFWQIISLWPVLLIAIGLDLLGKAMHTSWLRAVGSLAVIAALAYAVAASMGQVGGILVTMPSATETAAFSAPVNAVTEAKLELDAGVASVSLESGDDLVTASATSPWGEPDFGVSRSGSSADVRLSLEGPSRSFVWPGGSRAKLDATVSDAVLWDMEMTTGVSSLDADLRDVPVRSLTLKPGVADCEVVLGPVPAEVEQANALIEAGVSSVRLRLPKRVEARIESESGLTGHDVSSEFESLGSGVWQTPGFDQASSAGRGVWVVNIKSGIGSIVVDTY